MYNFVLFKTHRNSYPKDYIDIFYLELPIPVIKLIYLMSAHIHTQLYHFLTHIYLYVSQ